MAKPAFERHFRQNQKRVDRRLGAYLADPENEDNIHDVRVAIRRLDATFSLLPKKVRRRHRAGMEKYREFLKASSNARDGCANGHSLLDSIGYGHLAAGSRTTFATGIAVVKACKKVIAELCKRAAKIWEIKPDDVIWENGHARPAGEHKGRFEPISLKAIAAKRSVTGGPIVTGNRGRNIIVAPPGQGRYKVPLPVRKFGTAGLSVLRRVSERSFPRRRHYRRRATKEAR